MALEPEDRYASPLALAEAHRGLAGRRPLPGRAGAGAQPGEAARWPGSASSGPTTSSAGSSTPRGCSGWPAPWRTSRRFPGLERVVRASLGAWHARAKPDGTMLCARGRGPRRGVQPRRPSAGHGLRRRRRRSSGTWPRRRRSASPLTHDGPVTAVAFSPEGDIIATSDAPAMLRLWDAVTGRPLGRPMMPRRPGHGRAGSAPTAPSIATREPGGCSLPLGRRDPAADPASRAVTMTSRSWPSRSTPTARCSRPPATTAVSLPGVPRPGRPIGEPLVHRRGRSRRWLSTGRAQLLTGCPDGKARLWDLAGGRPARVLRCLGPPTLRRFSPAGDRVATASEDGTGPALGPRHGAADRRAALAPSRRSPAWRSAPTARCSRRAAATGPSGSGTPRPPCRSALLWSTGAPSAPWPSAPTAAGWPPAAPTAWPATGSRPAHPRRRRADLLLGPRHDRARFRRGRRDPQARPRRSAGSSAAASTSSAARRRRRSSGGDRRSFTQRRR